MASRSAVSPPLTSGPTSGLSANTSPTSPSSCAVPLTTSRMWLATSGPHCQSNSRFKHQGPTQSSNRVANRVASTFVGTMLRDGVRAGGAGRSRGSTRVHSELAGQYEESFADVEKQLFDYFTFKAVNTVLGQLLEMNPSQYTFLYNFVVNNKVRDSKLFIRSLVQERQELAERIMVTRLHLYNKWAKKYDHAAMHAAIKDQNLELLRERLMETVKFQAEDSEGSATS